MRKFQDGDRVTHDNRSGTVQRQVNPLSLLFPDDEMISYRIQWDHAIVGRPCSQIVAELSLRAL